MNQQNQKVRLQLTSCVHNSLNRLLPAFATPTWRNSLIASVLLYGAYTFAPSGNDDGNSLTKFIAKFYTPTTVWTEVNTERTILNKNIADGKILSQSAERPVIQRSRFPRSLSFFSRSERITMLKISSRVAFSTKHPLVLLVWVRMSILPTLLQNEMTNKLIVLVPL